MSARMDRRRYPALSALLAVTVAVSGGCAAVGTPDGAGGGASATPTTPRDVLLGSVPNAGSGAFRFAIDGIDLPVSGVSDPARRSYRLDLKHKDPDLGFTMTLGYLVVDKQSWVKVAFSGTEGLTGLPKLPKSWLLIDPTKVTDTGDVPVAYDESEIDLGNAGAVFRSIADVRRTAAGRYTGTTDLTKEPKAEFTDGATLKALGAKAKAVPFDAAVDAAGHLTSLVLTFPAAGKKKASRYAVTYRDYGKAPAVVKPAAGEQQKAPAAAYEMLNG
jgi:hypothetical protein